MTPIRTRSLRSRTLLALSTASLLAFAGAALANEKGDEWQKMDADGDGMVTAAESGTAARDMFSRADGDGDGRVTAAEMQAAHADKAGDSGKTAQDFNEKIRKMDGNNDGGVSADEFAATAREKHDKADADGDGNVSRAEFDAAMARHKAEKGAE